MQCIIFTYFTHRQTKVQRRWLVLATEVGGDWVTRCPWGNWSGAQSRHYPEEASTGRSGAHNTPHADRSRPGTFQFCLVCRFLQGVWSWRIQRMSVQLNPHLKLAMLTPPVLFKIWNSREIKRVLVTTCVDYWRNNKMVASYPHQSHQSHLPQPLRQPLTSVNQNSLPVVPPMPVFTQDACPYRIFLSWIAQVSYWLLLEGWRCLRNC